MVLVRVRVGDRAKVRVRASFRAGVGVRVIRVEGRNYVLLPSRNGQGRCVSRVRVRAMPRIRGRVGVGGSWAAASATSADCAVI